MKPYSTFFKRPPLDDELRYRVRGAVNEMPANCTQTHTSSRKHRLSPPFV